MADYALTSQAAEDIETIADNSITEWGLARAEAYILALRRAFEQLALFPGIGRDAGHVRLDYRQWPVARHSVFYTTTATGVLIVRVLHQSMDFERHFDV